MKILALIPARGGSKRLPGKNIRPLGGRPLLAWSVDAARGLEQVCDVLVTTDDEQIAAAAAAAGALVPWLRPAELATDTATSVDVCLHALDWYEREHGAVDGVLLLQPTTPYRRRSTLLRGIQLFESQGRHAVVGVAPAAVHPQWCMRVNGLQMRPYLSGEGLSQRSQDLPPAYAVCGAFYLVAPDELRQRGSFFSPDAVPLVIDEPVECIDIDTAMDWRLAEACLADFSALATED
jgi:CMP-N,N'-diacetyllegionaminic acid synthase